MARQHLDHRLNPAALRIQKGLELSVWHHVDDVMITRRKQALTEHDLGPTVFTKDIALSLKDAPRFLKQIQTMTQCVGNTQVGHIPPERIISSIVEMIMQDNKVSDELNFCPHLAVELLNIGCARLLMGIHLHQSDDGAHYEVNAGGF